MTDAYDFGRCKACAAPAAAPRYRLRDTEIRVCGSCGFHCIPYLDPVEAADPAPAAGVLTDEARRYIATQLHSNDARLREQVELLGALLPLAESRVLDVGCGGGRFLAALRERGAEPWGIDPDAARLEYARRVYGIQAVKHPVESGFWAARAGTFDAVTLWDVIEHVNFPRETLDAAARLLRPGGVLVVGTPSRDAFYHRVGVLGYRLSRGRFPTFLNAMYSTRPFGHKQILSLRDLRGFFDRAGVELERATLVHELTYPYAWYLRRMLPAPLAALARPLAAAVFGVSRIRNKMIVAGRRRAG